MIPSSIWTWLDAHTGLHAWGITAALGLAVALALRSLFRPQPDDAAGPDWGWAIMITAVLFAGRWPSLAIPREFNPDESQLLAGAHTLVSDPVFWRAVDGGTAGPLDFLALWPAGLLLGWTGYLPARLTALALLAVSLALAHQVLARLAGRAPARLAGLGALAFEALSNSVDFLHYSTELVPIALWTAAIHVAARRWLAPGGRWEQALGGLLLGAVPLAKLQAAPLAAATGLIWLAAEWIGPAEGRTQRITHLVAGAILPSFLFGVQLLTAGEWANAFLPYFHANVHYVAAGADSAGWLIRAILAKSAEQDSLLPLWLGATVLATILTVRRPRSSRLAMALGGAALAAALALGCVLWARREFLHYWQLLLTPLVLLQGTALANLLVGGGRTARWLAAAIAVGTVAAPLTHRLKTPNHFLGGFAYFHAHPVSPLGNFVARHAQPGDSLAIWGWTSSVYVETGLRQGARDAHFQRAVAPGPYRDYFRLRFLADLQANQPALFLDSAGPACPHFPDPRYAHDLDYPELADYIRANYDLVAAEHATRLYRRRPTTP